MKYYPMIMLTSYAVLAGCGDSDPAAGKPAGDTTNQTAEVATKTATPATEPVRHPLPGDPVAGAEVYKMICIACHQADGSGMNGLLAANFVADKTRLAKPNEVLLNSIRNGVTNGTRIMPPQKDVLTDKQIKDALSYVRKTFGDSE